LIFFTANESENSIAKWSRMAKHYDTIRIANLPVAGKTETKGA